MARDLFWDFRVRVGINLGLRRWELRGKDVYTTSRDTAARNKTKEEAFKVLSNALQVHHVLVRGVFCRKTIS